MLSKRLTDAGQAAPQGVQVRQQGWDGMFSDSWEKAECQASRCWGFSTCVHADVHELLGMAVATTMYVPVCLLLSIASARAAPSCYATTWLSM